ncbi:hypothetical protein SGCZBJ_13215 [Caulobacter zeae]|uniref:Uncharacterized protein n=1 Tax=Caulobacter zeae TaxID=2055137 RepID=A0A2N5DGI6_9CAUL|nr:hypothetical protein [Caulobacter zeae]PLR25183.1 hypothetical protein SGCZBJ_13215 [Caulobacter zeae]
MKWQANAWLDVVVVAQPAEQSGIAVKLVNASRGGDASTAERAMFNSIENWCVLAPWALPQTAQEAVFKLSRHVVEGRTFTWLGLYRLARYPRDPRTNNYVGVGVLVCTNTPPPRQAVDYITDCLREILGPSNEIDRPAAELADLLRANPPTFGMEGRRGGGLNAGGWEKRYVDLSGVDANQQVGALVELLEVALAHQSFNEVSELLVGTTPRLNQSVSASQAYTMADVRGQPHRQLVRAQEPGGHDEPVRVETAAPKRPAGEQEAAARDRRDIAALQARVSQVEQWIPRIEKRLNQREASHSRAPSPARESTATPEEVRQGHIAALWMVAIGVVSAAIGALLVMLYDSYQTPPDGGGASDLGACILADVNDRSPNGRVQIQKELVCREGEAERIKVRIDELKAIEPFPTESQTAAPD